MQRSVTTLVSTEHDNVAHTFGLYRGVDFTKRRTAIADELTLREAGVWLAPGVYGPERGINHDWPAEPETETEYHQFWNQLPPARKPVPYRPAGFTGWLFGVLRAFGGESYYEGYEAGREDECQVWLARDGSEVM